MGRRGGALGRRTAFRQPKRRCTIFCEGKRTEPEYFAAFKQKFPRSLFSIEIVGAAGVPATLLSRARSFRNASRKKDAKGRSFAENDEVWIAFDCDEHPRVKETLDAACAQDIGVAYSNPCFELWLTLHLEDFNKPIHRHDIQKRCEETLPGYQRAKGKVANYFELLDAIEDAERRADSLVKKREDEGAPLGCPCSTVQTLTRSLRGLDPTPVPR